MTVLAPETTPTMRVRALLKHRETGHRRDVADVYDTDPVTGAHLVAHGYVERVLFERDWTAMAGRELRADPLTDPAWPRVVACLNIWNDLPALRETLPTWIDAVDAVVVADGPYATTGAMEPLSTDGLADYLRSAFTGCDDVKPLACIAPPNDRPWVDQNTKRTAILDRAALRHPGALLLIVDADEYLTGDPRTTPYGDVAWCRVENPSLYRRPYGQPRLVRAVPGLRYDGRHHWLYRGDGLLATHQYGGTGSEHRWSPITLRNVRGLGHTPARAAAKRTHLQAQAAREVEATTGATAGDRTVGARESLRIAQTAMYDAGFVASRLHTALNTTTPHSSALFTDRSAGRNPYHGPGQYDLTGDQSELWNLLSQADVVHCHLDYSGIDRVGVRPARLVIHHHGTMYRKTPGPGWYNLVDEQRAHLRLVSNLELLRYGRDLHFLPNPVPVARYRRLRVVAPYTSGRFRVAHSPSKREFKGTDAFLRVCDRLRQYGVEPLLIEGVPHGEALALKATADACFDSFWLGLQCSGLEAAAMGLPVIAGDRHVAGQYRAWIGEVPYTFADTEADLEAAIMRLVTDRDYRDAEAQRVGAYVTTYHDEASVALRYLDLLDGRFAWRQAMRVASRPVAQMPEAVLVQAAKPVKQRKPRVPKEPKPRRVA